MHSLRHQHTTATKGTLPVSHGKEDTGRWSLVLPGGVSGVRPHFRDLIQLPDVSLAVNKLIAARISGTVPRLQHSHASGIGRSHVHLGVSAIGAFCRDHLDKLNHFPIVSHNFVDARIVIHRAPEPVSAGLQKMSRDRNFRGSRDPDITPGDCASIGNAMKERTDVNRTMCFTSCVI